MKSEMVMQDDLDKLIGGLDDIELTTVHGRITEIVGMLIKAIVPNVKIGEVPFMAGGMPGTYGKSSGVAGTVLEIDSYKDGELTTTMVVTEINEHADLLIKSAEFTLQGMPAVKFQ